MAVSVRSPLHAGLAAVAAIAIVLSCTAGPPVLALNAEHPVPISTSPARAFAVRLLAALQATATNPPPTHPTTTPVSGAATTPTARSTPTNAAAATGPAAATPTAATTAAATAVTFGLPGLQNAIINGYNTIMPWVDWGVEVAQWAVGWVPWVGWVAADQIGLFYFNLIRPIITSAVYNTAYVIGGSVGLFPAIGNFINDTGNAINGFIHAEINWALSFLPPLPPLPFAATKAAATKAAAAKSATAAAATATTTAGTVTKSEALKARATKDEATSTTVAAGADTKTTDVKDPGVKAADDPTAEGTVTKDKGDKDKSTKQADTGAPAAQSSTTKSDRHTTKAGKDGNRSGKAKSDSAKGHARSGAAGHHSGT